MLFGFVIGLNFALNKAAWEVPSISSIPRSSHTAVWDAETAFMYVFGGDGGTGLHRYSRETSSWTQLSPNGIEPSPRSEHTAVWDPSAAGMYVFAGHVQYQGWNFLDDLHYYSRQSNSWTELFPSGSAPQAREEHAAVWDLANARMYIFGGNAGSFLNDLHFYASQDNSWTQLSPGGILPSARDGHTAVWDDAVAGMYIFGGYDGSSLNDLHFYSSQDNSWTELLPSGTLPDGRFKHTAIWGASVMRMYVFGGSNDGYLNDLHAYSREGNNWVELTTGPEQEVRMSHSAVWDSEMSAMYVFGGWKGTRLDDLQTYRTEASVMNANVSTTTTITTTTMFTNTSSTTETSLTSTTGSRTWTSFTTSSSTGTTFTSSTTSETSVTTSSTTETSVTSSSTTMTSTSSTRSTTTTTMTTSTFTTATSSSSTSTSQTTTSSSSTSTSSSSITSSSSTSTSSTSSSTTSTSTTTLKQTVVLPAAVDGGNPQGSVVIATLESALAAFNSQEESAVFETPAGKVTVVKLEKIGQSDQSLVFTFSASGGESNNDSSSLLLHLPAFLIADAEVEGNLMLVLLSVGRNISESMPRGGPSDTTVLANSRVLDISLVKEVAGAVEIVNISDLLEPLSFRIKEDAPVEGDYCASFDLIQNVWSPDGLHLANNTAGQITGVADNGTWCLSSHLSLFAVVQRIPFDLLIDASDQNLDVEAYGAALAIMGATAFIVCCLTGVWMSRRVHTPAAGKTKIRAQRGGTIEVTFTRSEVEQIEKSEHDIENGASFTSKKALVRWDVDPKKLLPQIPHLQGHRSVRLNLDAPQTKVQTVEREATQNSTKEELRKFASSVEAEELNAESPLAPSSERFPSELEALPQLDDELHGVFEHGDPVSYWSKQHQALWPGRISGHAYFPDTAEAHYDVLVGPKHQLRQQVPCSLLHPAFQVDEPVFYLYIGLQQTAHTSLSVREKIQMWRKATISSISRSQALLQLVDQDESPLVGSTDALEGPFLVHDVAYDRVRRRFSPEDAVMVYRGGADGWVPARIQGCDQSDDVPRDAMLVEVCLPNQEVVNIPSHFVQHLAGVIAI
ncbi:Leucine-zipper-like transcriptional regulator 1 homolog [Durusdinium trenchii]